MLFILICFLFCFFSSLLASLFGMARIFYSIAYDGLIFKYLSKVNSCTRTPVRSTAISGLLTGLISILFSTEQLIEMTSLGTLMAYTMVAVCVLILRYTFFILVEFMIESLKLEISSEEKWWEPSLTLFVTFS